MQKAIVLTVSLQEANTLLQVLGSQPSHTGVYPLLISIKEQAETQLQPQPAAPIPE